MPTYIFDITLSDRYLDQAQSELLRRMVHTNTQFELRDEWLVGSVHFWRFTRTYEATSLEQVFNDLVALKREALGSSNIPVVAQTAIRDVRYSLEDTVSYRHRPVSARTRPSSGGPAG